MKRGLHPLGGLTERQSAFLADASAMWSWTRADGRSRLTDDEWQTWAASAACYGTVTEQEFEDDRLPGRDLLAGMVLRRLDAVRKAQGRAAGALGRPTRRLWEASCSRSRASAEDRARSRWGGTE